MMLPTFAMQCSLSGLSIQHDKDARSKVLCNMSCNNSSDRGGQAVIVSTHNAHLQNAHLQIGSPSPAHTHHTTQAERCAQTHCPCKHAAVSPCSSVCLTEAVFASLYVYANYAMRRAGARSLRGRPSCASKACWREITWTR